MHFTAAGFPLDASPASRPYYGWSVLLVAAVAMVGTLPGRTQGLGLITEPLLRDLGLDRVTYAQLNLWATLLGAAAVQGYRIGQWAQPAGTATCSRASSSAEPGTVASTASAASRLWTRAQAAAR